MINQAQTKIIRDYLLGEGFTHVDLLDDLADHISCKIEMLLTDSDLSFENALLIARQEVMPDYALQIEDDLKFLTTKKQNTMIKKLAFIGGYASAVCLCLSILFFSQSLMSTKKTELKSQAIQLSNYLDQKNSKQEGGDKASEELNTFVITQRLQAYDKFNQAETLLIIALMIFICSYLPYKFYNNYQKTDDQLYHA